MATTPQTTLLEKGAITPSQTEQTGSNSAVSLIQSLLNTPTLPQGAAITPTGQSVQQNELISTPGVTGTIAALAPAATAPAAATSSTRNFTTGIYGNSASTAQFGAATIDTAPTMTAAQGTVANPMTAATQSLASRS